MKKMLILVAVSFSTAASESYAESWIVEGVYMNAVPWATFCSSVKPVKLKTGAGSCPISHPASHRHAKWNGFGMDGREPKPNCKRFEREYVRFTSPRLGTTLETRTRSRWGTCIGAFSRALKQRVEEQERFSEPFAVWRSRYFGDYIHSPGG